MATLLERAKSSYDFVVVDTSPLGAVSDALPLVREVDGVAIVAGMGRNRRDVAKRLRDTLISVDAPLLGVIANRVKARRSALYGYGYGYGYDSDVSTPWQVAAAANTNGHAAVETIGPADARVPERNSERAGPSA